MSDMPPIVCAGCGKKYKWKAELAGKKVRCKCGEALEIPQAPQEDDPSDDSFGAIELADVSGDAPSKPASPSAPPIDSPVIGEIKIAGLDDDPPDAIGMAHDPEAPAVDDGKCPSCGAALAPGAVLCVQCGFNRNTGKKIGTVDADAAAERPAGEDAPSTKMHELKQWKIPLGILIAGFVLNFLYVWMQSGGEQGAPVAAGSTVVGMLFGTAIGVVFMVIAAFIAAKLLDTTFGDIHTAVLKLAAIYVAPGVLASVMASFAGDWSWAVGIVVLGGSYFGLLMWLFDFDLGEAMIFAIIGWVIKYWIVIFMLGMFMRGM